MPKKKYNFTWCNKEVLRYESSVKNNKHIFCCNECRSKFLSKKHNPDGYIKHPHLSEYNLKNNPTHPVINDFSVKMKLRDARLGSGEGKSYKKIFGRHEHRIVAERILGRALKKGEVVHHIDGDKRNNSIDNLMIFDSQSEHIKWHLENDEKYKNRR